MKVIGVYNYRNTKKIISLKRKNGKLDDFYVNKIKKYKTIDISKNYNFKCVYFLYDNEKIVYIGASEKFLQRIISHINSEKHFNYYSYIEILKGDMYKLERRLIDIYLPKYNNDISTKIKKGNFTENQISKYLEKIKLSQLYNYYERKDGGIYEDKSIIEFIYFKGYYLKFLLSKNNVYNFYKYIEKKYLNNNYIIKSHKKDINFKRIKFNLEKNI